MTTKVFVGVNSLSSEDRSRLKSAISEINDSMVRVSSEKELQKDFVDKVAEDLGLDKKLIRRLSKAYYKANFNAEVSDFQTFEEFYALLFTSPTTGTTNVGTSDQDEFN